MDVLRRDDEGREVLPVTDDRATERGTARTALAERRKEPQQRLTLLHPTRSYAVSRNPFVIPAILPLTVAAFLAVEVAVLVGANPLPTAGGLMFFVTGLLAIAAVNQRGVISLTHDGVVFQQGTRRITSDWDHVAGIVSRPTGGLCLEIVKPEMSEKKISAPGGLCAEPNSTAVIPLRMFGDRQYSIMYDLRERLPEQRWKDVLAKASERSPQRILFVYGATVAICCLAMFVVMWVQTH
jgi:hypothetical protein